MTEMTNTETPIEVTREAHAVAQRIISNIRGYGVTIGKNHSAALAIEELINKATETQSAEIARLRAENERLREKVDAITNGETFLFLSDSDHNKAAAELDDASLAKWARWVCVTATKNYEKFAEERGRNIMEYLSTMSIVSLARLVASTNASKANFNVEGATWADQQEGQDWRVTIERIDKAALAGESA